MQITQFNDNFRVYKQADGLVELLDTSLRTLFGKPTTTVRKNPAEELHNVINLNNMTETEQQQSASLMRVNHCGEVCAQALYQGQALIANNQQIKAKLKQAALEENDHLSWCQTRLTELNSHTSYLNPLWYIGSLSVGIIAGIAGDRWNLGFLAETEAQVTEHLAKHLLRLPINDYRSRAIILQMKIDEETHATVAREAGGYDLPSIVIYTMRWSAKIMTTVAYYI